MVDKKGHIIAVLVAPPVPGGAWADVVEQATAAMRAAREKMSFPADAYHHRRAFEEGFPTENTGFAFGGGREEVGNVRCKSAQNARAMDELLEDTNVRRMATYPYRERASCFFLFLSLTPGRLQLLFKPFAFRFTPTTTKPSRRFLSGILAFGAPSRAAPLPP